MSVNRSKTDQQSGNLSFQQPKLANHLYEPNHMKKGSEHKKTSKGMHCIRLKTDERQGSTLFKNEALNPYTVSVNEAFSNSKASKNKQKSTICGKSKKSKKDKHTVSIISLCKNERETKVRGSPTTTKRKQTLTDLGQKIQGKVQDFQILSNCFEEYVKEERKNNSSVNTAEIIKIIGAFNRSQIAAVSKPLQTLISNILKSIQLSLPPQQQLKSILKKSISFESPNKPCDEVNDVVDTVKKNMANKQMRNKVRQTTGNIQTLQQNLGRLKYESNRLKYFLQQISSKGQSGKKRQNEEGRDQLRSEQFKKLKEIAKDQARIIQELENSSSKSEDTFREDSPL